jgi:hypothetical protein
VYCYDILKEDVKMQILLNLKAEKSWFARSQRIVSRSEQRLDHHHHMAETRDYRHADNEMNSEFVWYQLH